MSPTHKRPTAVALKRVVCLAVVLALLTGAPAAKTWIQRQPVAAHVRLAGDVPQPARPRSLPRETVALGVYRPDLPSDFSEVARYEAAADRDLAIVHWFAYWEGWKRDLDPADLAAVSARGSVPMITWEPWAGKPADPDWSLRAAILSGRNDDYIDAWARALADYGKPVLLRFAQEMHTDPRYLDSAYPWALGVNGNTARDYVNAWKYVRKIFSRYNTTNVQWVWNPNTLGDAKATVYRPIYRALYPGDAYVDWIGLDIYNTGPNVDWNAPYWRPFDRALAEPYKAITGLTEKPLLLGEVGSAEAGGSKPAWISEALSSDLRTRFPRVRALVWFDVNKEERWAIDSSPASLAAWITAADQPLFAASPNHPIRAPAVGAGTGDRVQGIGAGAQGSASPIP